MNGHTCSATPPPRPASEPTSQKRMTSSVCRSIVRTNDVSEAKSAATAAPAIASFSGLAPSRPTAPIAYAAAPPTAAPRNANQIDA
jgi:hypothetical protein